MKHFILLAGTALLATLAFAPAHAETVKTEVAVQQQDIPDLNKVYFTQLDYNHDGVLSRNEVGDRLFRSFDKDGNREIDNIEFDKKAVLTIVPMEKEILKMVDWDDDGKSDVTTYTTETFMQASGLARFDKNADGLSPHEFINKDFKELDTSKNHYIELKEWQAAYRKVFAHDHDNPKIYNK